MDALRAQYHDDSALQKTDTTKMLQEQGEIAPTAPAGGAGPAGNPIAGRHARGAASGAVLWLRLMLQGHVRTDADIACRLSLLSVCLTLIGKVLRVVLRPVMRIAVHLQRQRSETLGLGINSTHLIPRKLCIGHHLERRPSVVSPP